MKKSHLGSDIQLFFLLLCFIFNTTACNSIHQNNTPATDSTTLLTLPPPAKISDEVKLHLQVNSQRWYDAILAPGRFNGQVLIAKDGNIVFEKYTGNGHIPGNDPITENTPMHIASISKTFTAMAVLKLWQDGLLKLDAELSTYFPAFNYPGVTIRSLLNHRSGLPNYNYFMETLGWDTKNLVKNEDILTYLITRKSELQDISTPNTHFTYCNTNYALLALLIEKISGLNYGAYLQKVFFTPLQMKNSYVFSRTDSARAIPSYNWRGGKEAFTFLDLVYGDKNIYTTVRDLLIWDRALNTNLIFTKETLEQAYTPYSNERRGYRNYGLGWRMNVYPNLERNSGTGSGDSLYKIIYHNGWWHGSNASFIRLLKEKGTIIVIGNKFNRGVYKSNLLIPVFGGIADEDDEEEHGIAKVDSTPAPAIQQHTPSKKQRSTKKSGRKTKR